MSVTTSVLVLLAVMLAVFATLEGFFGKRPRPERAHVRTDLLYMASDIALNVVAGALRLAIPGGLSWLAGRVWHGPLWETHLALQLVLGALILEFGIWLAHLSWHRFDVLYPFHAVHHASRHVYFLSGLRQHPVQFLGDQIFFATLLALAGVTPSCVVALSGFQLVMTFYTHSNLDLRVGFLKHVLASPRFHVLHHDSSGRGDLKNLGGGLSVFDWAFGTALDPDQVSPPESLGNGDPSYPRSYLGQLVHPFRKLAGRAS